MARPKQIIDAIKFGRERYVLADTVVRLTKEFRTDYVPGAKTWEAFQLLLILHRMIEVDQRGRESSALVGSRRLSCHRHATHNDATQAGTAQANGRRGTARPALHGGAYVHERQAHA
jgi:hypothetical protein